MWFDANYRAQYLLFATHPLIKNQKPTSSRPAHCAFDQSMQSFHWTTVQARKLEYDSPQAPKPKTSINRFRPLFQLFGVYFTASSSSWPHLWHCPCCREGIHQAKQDNLSLCSCKLRGHKNMHHRLVQGLFLVVAPKNRQRTEGLFTSFWSKCP